MLPPRVIYSLTTLGIELLPILAEIGIWGRHHLPVTRESGAAAAALEKGGPSALKKMQSDLRRAHLNH